ncbi:MAG: SusC/RagA family TonB-linked outer membrane protein [Sphingobacteriaceae bacterium]|nr:MAG: SusC/RagA family TonB-linked outer membrane protein [Sphingobacteriaceae bacterium]
MKLSVLVLLLALMQVSAASVAQKISLKKSNVPLTEALSAISAQSGYSVLYDEDLLRNAEKVSLNLKNATLQEALNLCFGRQPFTYTINKRSILITPKPVSVTVKAPAAPVQLSGKVTDEKGGPIPGATVKLKTGNVSTSTDSNGEYKITIPDEQGAILVFSYIGFETKEIEVNGQLTIDVSLKEALSNLDEVVVVGYGAQKKATITGSISTVKSDELTQAPVANVTNALAGRLPGLISQQSSGQPGYDAASLSIRGFGGALVIIDGVESNINNIDANQIESISILKDAAAAIYGARAGNGVILITTKRGVLTKPVFTLTSSYTLQGITSMIKPVSAGQYAEMSREAWLQSGQPEANAPFTTEQIAKYYAGNDPDYPNTNWYDVLIRDWAPQTQNNLSVRGGSDNIRYYGFIGYTNQQSMWKNNGGNYNRYNLQSNIDAKISDDLSLQLDLSSVVESRNFPNRPQNAGGNTVWQDFWNTLPIYPAELPDPTKISFANGGGTGGAHVTSNSEIFGYDKLGSQNLKGTLNLNYKIPVVEGLSAKLLLNYLQDYSNNKNFNKPVNFYTYDNQSQMYTLAGSLGSLAALAITNSRNQVLTGQGSIAYDRTFNDHHIQGLALYELINYSSDYSIAGRSNFLTPAIDQLFAGNAAYQTANGAAAETGRKSYVGRINYAYKGKYLLEATLRADASAKFPKDKQWGYFPGVSVGWRLSEEQFMSSTRGFMDDLKIRASFGKSGNDGVGNFQYLSGYQYGGSYLIGNNPQQGLSSTGLANPNLTWETIKIYNAGFDASFWDRKLYGTFDVFYRERSGIPASRVNSLPSTFGSGLPPENLNSLNNRGFDLKLGTAGKKGEFSWDVSANISWARAKWMHYEEPEYEDPDQRRLSKLSGRWTDVAFGYVTDGLFTSMEEIAALGFNQDGQANISLRPGDIKYVDVNKDGILNYKDQVEIGKGTVPQWMGGFNLMLKYADFDMGALLQGAFGYYTYITLQHGLTPPVQSYDLRWTEANNDANALVPRLGGASTNGLPSEYYYKEAGYIRLKSFSIGYTLPAQLLQKISFKQLRVFFAGTNLLTFDKLKKYGADPEAPTGNLGFYYPQQRTLSFGLNASF